MRSADALQRLESAPAGELEQTLEQLDLPRTISTIAGNVVTGIWRGSERRALVQLLCFDRVDELSPRMRAEIVHGLRRLPPSPSVSAGVRSMLTSLTGEPFRDMKYLLNASGDRHDLEHVVYERLSPADRDAVLAHIASEAASKASNDLRILCDIDDTLQAKLHDRSYPHGTVYPGVVELLTALDDGRAAQPSRPGDLTFVTARPEGPKGFVEQYTRNALTDLGLPPHSVMGGSVFNIFTKSSIKARKLQNFERERSLFPECRFLFLGDSGQADAQVGAEMLRRGPEFVVAVLIHEVVPVTGARRAALEQAGIRFYSSYDQAARVAHELGLIDRPGRDAVVRAVDEASGMMT